MSDTPATRAPEPTLSKREWYAGLAMQSVFGDPGARGLAAQDGRYDGTNWAEIVALNAREMADAMLAALDAGAGA